VFGEPERYPLSPARGYTPHPCSLAQYRVLTKALGVQRAVLVQPSVYGTDNSALLDALEEGGPAFRGVAVPHADIDFAGLQKMHDAGVRGFRLNLVNPAVLSVADAASISRQVVELGWHLDLQLDLSRQDSSTLLGQAARLPVPLVVDHFGLAPSPEALRALISMLEGGRCWIKMSAPYRLPAGARQRETLHSLVRALVSANPTRLLWGSDWPHTELRETVHAGEWLEQLLAWLPAATVRQQVFVQNPSSLYGF
jgi:predicted TIM-barrel fold metal-dependent hydrolase